MTDGQIATHAELFDLTGKSALVTGGTRGIGMMMARGLLQAGARVVISSRKADACGHPSRSETPHAAIDSTTASLARAALSARAHHTIRSSIAARLGARNG